MRARSQQREAADDDEVMRSQLGRARGLGAAHAGLHHWQVERITAIALVPLTVWFVVSVLVLLGADQPRWCTGRRAR